MSGPNYKAQLLLSSTNPHADRVLDWKLLVVHAIFPERQNLHSGGRFNLACVLDSHC